MKSKRRCTHEVRLLRLRFAPVKAIARAGWALLHCVGKEKAVLKRLMANVDDAKRALDNEYDQESLLPQDLKYFDAVKKLMAHLDPSRRHKA